MTPFHVLIIILVLNALVDCSQTMRIYHLQDRVLILEGERPPQSEETFDRSEK